MMMIDDNDLIYKEKIPVDVLLPNLENVYNKIVWLGIFRVLLSISQNLHCKYAHICTFTYT